MTTPRPPARAYRATLRAYLGPQWRKAAALGVVMLADISLDLVAPQIQQRFIDGALAAVPVGDLGRLAGLALAMAIAVQLLFVVASYLSADIAQVGTNRLREDLLGHVLRLDHGFHNAHTPGELIERIDGDVALLSNFLSRFLLEVVGSLLLLAGALGLLLRIDWRIGGTLALVTLVSFVVLRALMEAAAGRWEADRAAMADLFGFLEERLAGTEDIRSAGATGYVMRRLFERARIVWQRRLRATAFGIFSGELAFLFVAVGTVVALGLGAAQYRAGAMTIGTVYLVFSYCRILQAPLGGLTRQIRDLQQAGAAIGRVGQLLTTVRQVREAERPVAIPEGPLDVVFDDVSFAYDAPAPGPVPSTSPIPGTAGVIDRITLAVPAGTSLGLLGRTGSGKTTLTRLLFRLVDPTAGAVRLGGVDLRAARLADLRRRVALVTQDVQLFHASVRENLTFFDATIPDAAIAAAVEAVGLGGWLARLPEGLSTRLAPGGGGLSAGQAQLLALARVFLRDPDVVVLDEASSRLDPATEAQLDRALGRLLTGRTVIVIAHRLATVQRVDAIAILDSGRVVEHGPRAVLAADGESRFAGLLQAGEAAMADGLPSTSARP